LSSDISSKLRDASRLPPFRQREGSPSRYKPDEAIHVVSASQQFKIIGVLTNLCVDGNHDGLVLVDQHARTSDFVEECGVAWKSRGAVAAMLSRKRSSWRARCGVGERIRDAQKMASARAIRANASDR